MRNRGWKFGEGEYPLPPEYPVDKFVDTLEDGLKRLQTSIVLYPQATASSMMNMANLLTTAAVQSHDELARLLMRIPEDLSPEAEAELVKALNYHASVARLRLQEALIMCARTLVSLDQVLGDPTDDLPTA